MSQFLTRVKLKDLDSNLAILVSSFIQFSTVGAERHFRIVERVFVYLVAANSVFFSAADPLVPLGAQQSFLVNSVLT